LVSLQAFVVKVRGHFQGFGVTETRGIFAQNSSHGKHLCAEWDASAPHQTIDSTETWHFSTKQLLALWHYRAEPNRPTPDFAIQHLPVKGYPMIAIARHEAESAPQLSHHASKRMQMRNISPQDIEHALDYGRTFFSRGGVFKVIDLPTPKALQK
jgi:hypothetical protein